MKDHRDPSTGFYTPEYFYETGEIFRANAVRNNVSFVVGVIDIEFSATAIEEATAFIAKTFRTSDIITRFEGGTFGVVAINVDDNHIKEVFGKLISSIDNEAKALQSMPTHIGVCATLYASFSDMVKVATQALGKAKEHIHSNVYIDFEGL